MLIRASLSVMKHSDQNQLEDKSSYSTLQFSGLSLELEDGRKLKARTWRQELKTEALGGMLS